MAHLSIYKKLADNELKNQNFEFINSKTFSKFAHLIKTMKKTTIFSVLFIAVFAFGMLSFTSNKKVIAVVFNKEMTRQDLMSLQKNLKDKNIILVFNKMKFVKNKLSYIDFSIDFGDGFSGTSKSEITKSKEIGFLRDYNENADQPFIIGDLR